MLSHLNSHRPYSISTPIAAIVVLSVILITACATHPAHAPVQSAAPPAAANAAGLFAHSGLPEALVPVGVTPSAKDNLFLSAALRQFAVRADAEDVSVLTSFLAAYPDSPWRVSILTNLGLIYYHSGRFSLALAAFEDAWQSGKHNNGAGPDKALVDFALGELVRMHARLGHKEELRRLLSETKSRSLTRAATERLAGAKEGLWMMDNEPGVAYLCGPKALASIIDRLHLTHAKRELVESARSGPQGYSLDQVEALAKQARLGYRMVKRDSGAELVLPSVVHWKANHYAALIDEQGGLLHIKDPTFGNDLWISKNSLEQEASGYMLIPEGKLPKGYQTVAVAEAAQVYGRGYVSSSDANRTRPDDDKAKPCPICDTGLCQYNFHTLLVSLNLSDTPVGYVPPVGPPVRFTATYNQREANQPANFTYSNLGAKWTFNWLSYLEDDPANAAGDSKRYVAGGGAEMHTGYSAASQSFAPQASSQSVLVRTAANPVRYELRWPDGSVDVYSRSDGNTVAPRKVFLTEKRDPQGNSVNLTYDSQLRITQITDALGQATSLTYAKTDDPYKITQVTDPFGRSAGFAYTGSQMTAITDVIGLQSQFTYGSNQFINALTTPYGVTTFAYGESGTYRWLEATDPQGDKERLEYYHKAPGIVHYESVVPSIPLVTNKYLQYRNSFYWDKHAMTLAPGDYTQARLTHWLHGDYTGTAAAGVKESGKEPLENRVWYNYSGQTSSISVNDGMMEKPTHVGRVLDDGSTQHYQYAYNPAGNITQAIDPLGRETVYEYAANGIDLLRVKQKNGAVYDLLAEFTYNPRHRPLTYKDAGGAVTTLTWNSAGKLLTVTNALNEKTTYNYSQAGYLLNVVNPLNHTQFSFTYDSAGRIATATDESGYTLSYTYDDLDRLIQTTYPDGTSRRLTYDKLDLASVIDRLNRTTAYAYNPVRQLEQITDALGQITHYTWCGCGSLAGLTDALGQLTTFSHDVQGRLIAKRYADGQGIDYLYENSTSRVKTRSDALQQETTYSYATDNAILDIVYANAANPTPARHFSYDSVYPRLAAFDNGQGQTALTYQPAGTAGAGRLAQETAPDGYVLTYGYDTLNRLASTDPKEPGGVFGEHMNLLSYDALGRLIRNDTGLALNGGFFYNYVGDSRRLLQISYPNSTQASFGYFANIGDFRLKTLNYTKAATLLMGNAYTYDAEGQIATWQRSGAGPGQAGFGYDALGQLLQVTGTKTYAYAYDAAGNRIQETVGSQTANAVYNPLNQLLSSGADSYSHDTEGNQSQRQSASLGNRRTLWDAENRLIAVENPANTTTRSDFHYDALGRRIGLQDQINGALTKDLRLVYCGSTLCAKEDRLAGSFTRYYGGGDSRDGQPRYTFRDHLGSVRAVSDSTGSLIAAFAYDPYGRRTVLSGAASDSDFGYTGHFTHPATGLALAPYRGYDANIGRWLSRDPIGEAGGANLYTYVLNNPLRYTDPQGLFALPLAIPLGQALVDAATVILGGAMIADSLTSEDEGQSVPIDLPENIPDFDFDKPGQCPVDKNGNQWPWKGKLPQGGDKVAIKIQMGQKVYIQT